MGGEKSGLPTRNGLKVFVVIFPFLGNFGWPFPSQDGPPEKKSHLESGLNQLDRATAGFGRDRSQREPCRKFYWRGFTRRQETGGTGTDANTRKNKYNGAHSHIRDHKKQKKNRAGKAHTIEPTTTLRLCDYKRAKENIHTADRRRSAWLGEEGGGSVWSRPPYALSSSSTWRRRRRCCCCRGAPSGPLASGRSTVRATTTTTMTWGAWE